MKEKDIPYRNSYVYVERVTERNKVIYKVFRTDGIICFVYKDKKDAINYAKHLETWKPLWGNESKD